MANLVVKNYRGGYTTNDSRTIADNQFVSLRNFAYNTSSQLETTPGYLEFGPEIGGDPMTSLFYHKLDDGTRLLLATAGTGLYRYDDATPAWDLITNKLTAYNTRSVLSQMEDATGWSAVSDASGVATSTTFIKQGDGAVKFFIPDAGIAAFVGGIVNSTLTPVDWTAYAGTGLVKLWFNFMTVTGVTGVRLRWGSDATNYWEKTVTTQYDGSAFSVGDSNFLSFDWATASQTGTPDFTAIDYCQIVLTYDGTFTGHTGAPPSYNEDPFVVDFIAVYPTDDAATTLLARSDFVVYKNVVYSVNGIDPYWKYDPSTEVFTMLGGPQGTNIEYLNDVGFIGGDELFPHRLYYTDALPTNLNDNKYTNAIDVGADDTRTINVIRQIGLTIVVGKNEKSYDIDVTNAVARPIDATGGMFAYRAVRSVGNGLVYQSARGLETLQGKDGVSSASAIETSTLSEDILELISTQSPDTRNYSCGIYIKNSFNYYYTFDSDNDGIPETTVIYSSKADVQAFTTRAFPPIYDYTEYETADGELIYLFASASGGQAFQFETGIVDVDVPIDTELVHKKWDFGRPNSLKFFNGFTFVGQKNEGGQITCEIYIDDQLESSFVIDDTFADLNAQQTSNPINTNAINTQTIGGGLVVTTGLVPYIVRLPIAVRGNTLQVKMTTDTITATRYIPERLEIDYDLEDMSLFPFNNIA